MQTHPLVLLWQGPATPGRTEIQHVARLSRPCAGPSDAGHAAGDRACPDGGAQGRQGAHGRHRGRRKAGRRRPQVLQQLRQPVRDAGLFYVLCGMAIFTADRMADGRPSLAYVATRSSTRSFIPDRTTSARFRVFLVGVAVLVAMWIDLLSWYSMIAAARLSAAIEVLADIEARRRPASDAFKDWGLRTASPGPAIAPHRQPRCSTPCAGGPPRLDAGAETPRAVLLGALKLAHGWDPERIAGAVHWRTLRPEPLTDEERPALTPHPG